LGDVRAHPEQVPPLLALEDEIDVVIVEVGGKKERREQPPVEVLLVVGHDSCTRATIEDRQAFHHTHTKRKKAR
jgi:hypothetical protein